MHALGIAVGGQVVGLDVDGDLDRGHVQPLLAHRVREQRLDPELGAVERHGARLEAGEVEELRDEAAEPLDLVQHRPERLRIGVGDPVGEVLERHLERGDRASGARATRSPRDRAASGRSAASSATISLKAWASAPTSSWDVVVTRRL